jgi:hypothetical protein
VAQAPSGLLAQKKPASGEALEDRHESTASMELAYAAGTAHRILCYGRASSFSRSNNIQILRSTYKSVSAWGALINANFNPSHKTNMKTRNGKIARLPLELRDQLNFRLADGEPGNRLVEWLNSSPDVVKVMAEQFEGRPITENNLSEWRAGGYEEWLTLHAFLDETRVLSENAGEIADTGISSDHLHIVLLAHHAHLLQNLEIMPENEFKNRLNTVRKLTASIMNMRRGELQKARVQLQNERLELLREKQNLKSAEAIGRGAGVGAGVGAGGCPGKGGGPGEGRDSSSKAAASTSSNVRAAAAETRNAATPSASPSGPDIRSSAESSQDESAAPPIFTLDPKPALKVPILSGRIQPQFPDPSIRLPISRDWSDSVGLSLISTLPPCPFVTQLFPEADSVECTTRMRHIRSSMRADLMECTARKRFRSRRGALIAWRQEPQSGASTRSPNRSESPAKTRRMNPSPIRNSAIVWFDSPGFGVIQPRNAQL